MKVVELKNSQPTVDELIGMAEKGLVVLRKSDGSVFALSHVDDFDVEVEILKNNAEFMAWLKQLSQEKTAISMKDLRAELGV